VDRICSARETDQKRLKFSVRKPEGKISLGVPWRRTEDNIKMCADVGGVGSSSEFVKMRLNPLAPCK
jgi:hypothetical protein